jgi:drug/metabolite transporter (DMT)-like permease
MHSRLIGIFFVLCSVIFEGFAQLCLKQGAIKDSAMNSKCRWTLLGMALFASEAFAWTMALHHVDVGMAYPMGSLSFVVIAVFSQLWLKEKVQKQRWLGVGLIIGGTTLVGLS